MGGAFGSVAGFAGLGVPEDLTEVGVEPLVDPADAGAGVVVFFEGGTVLLAEACGTTAFGLIADPSALGDFGVPVACFGAPRAGAGFETFGAEAPLPGTVPDSGVSGFDGTPGRRSAKISTARAAPV